MPQDALQQLESCPEKEHLREFLLGKIAEADISVFESHISDCPACEDTIRGLNTSDTLVAIAGSAFENILDEAVAGTADQLLVDELISQMKSHRETTGIDSHQHQLESRSAEVTRLLTPTDDEEYLGTLAHYRVIKMLGAGSTGVVYQAQDQKLDRTVALKVLRPSLGEAAKERFLAEARLAASIDHPNVITIYEVGDEDPLAFMAMQWVPGETLQDRLQRQPIMTEPQAIELGQQIAAGLAAAHAKNLIHRDIKPANIWMTDEGDQARILDFGLARIADDDPQMTATGMLAGTPNFMSPEQTRGQELDGRSDLFSLGCVLYSATTGRLPFGGNGILATLQSIQADHPRPAVELNPNLSDEFSNTISCLLEKQPINRPRSAKELENGIKSPPIHWQSSSRSTTSPSAKTNPQGVGFRHIAAAVGLILMAWAGWMFAPQIIRIATDKGELVIETMDDSIEVQILKNGKEIALLDTKTQQRIDIKSGTYDIQVKDSKNRFNITPNEVVMSRGSKQLVSIKQIKQETNVADGNAEAEATSQVASGELTSDAKASPAAQAGSFPGKDPVPHDANRQYLPLDHESYGLNTLLYAARNWLALSQMNDGENRLELYALVEILDRINTMQTTEFTKRYVYEKAAIENDAHRFPSLLRSYRDNLDKIRKLKLNPEDLKRIEAVIEANMYPLLARAAFVKQLLFTLKQYEEEGTGAKETIDRTNALEMVFRMASNDSSRVNLLKFNESLQQNATQDKASLDILALKNSNWDRLNPGARSEDTFTPLVKLGLNYLDAQSKLTSLLFETRKLGPEHRNKLLMNQELSLQWSNWIVYQDLQSRLRGEQLNRQVSSADRMPETNPQGTANISDSPIYQGKTFEQWLEVLKKERDKAAIGQAIDATAELSRDNPTKQRIFVDSVFRPLLRKHGKSYWGDDGEIIRHLVESFSTISAQERIEYLLQEIVRGNKKSRSALTFLTIPIQVDSVVSENERTIHREFRRKLTGALPAVSRAMLEVARSNSKLETDPDGFLNLVNLFESVWAWSTQKEFYTKYYSSLPQDIPDPRFVNNEALVSLVQSFIQKEPDNLAIRVLSTRIMMRADPQPKQLKQLGDLLENPSVPNKVKSRILEWTESLNSDFCEANVQLMLRLLNVKGEPLTIGVPGLPMRSAYQGQNSPEDLRFCWPPATLQERALMTIAKINHSPDLAQKTLNDLNGIELVEPAERPYLRYTQTILQGLVDAPLEEKKLDSESSDGSSSEKKERR